MPYGGHMTTEYAALLIAAHNARHGQPISECTTQCHTAHVITTGGK